METTVGKIEPMWRIILKYSITPIITAMLGFGSGVYFIREGYITAEKQLYLNHRVAQAEAVAIHFEEYIENWRRLIQISAYEKQKGYLDKIQKTRKDNFVNSRNVARDKLFGSLSALELYFSQNVLLEVAKFRKWDDDQTIKLLGELPPVEEWRERKKAVLTAIHKELEGR